ncbi:hemin receptor [Marivirga lumbricoides]|uniref:Hemin receptor n=2 Tax=Marivirga lumbricoides TaxID=1046115 RepID=A0ABQ1N7Y7_9BACT|nr:hemin receptor [Marivirga lumbricoides]
MVKFIFAVGLCAITFSVSAQQGYSTFVDDAVRFSQSTTSGTARFIGLGGANTSLGGDISSISGNPAGLGFYNKSAWSISPVLRFGEFNANYGGVENNDFGANLQVPNGGMVFHKRFEEYSGSKWISGTFGIAYNQKTSFYNTIDYRGSLIGGENNIPYDFVDYTLQPFINPDGSYINYPSEAAIEPDFLSNPYSDLASLTGLLTIFPAGEGYEVDRYDFDQIGDVQQTERILRTGGVTTLDLSYGANYNDKLYLGAGLNINFINYTETRTFRETPSNDILNYLELTDRKEISGAGVGVTVGAIYKPIQMVNIGVSYTSPTFIGMDEIQEIQLDAIYFNEQDASAEIVNEVPSYSFVIPQKVSGGATVFLSKYGFVTADVEWVDYASARFNSNDGAFANGEPDVSNNLASALNYRLGVEGRLDIFRVRAGYALFGNPYSENTFEQNRSTVSGGVGIFKNGFSADLTYSLNSFNNPAITPYAGAASVSSESKISAFRLTLGKTF